MLFVTGGAYQGKLDYVKNRFKIDDSDIFICSEDSPLDLSKRCIYHYERYVMYALNKGEEPIGEFTDKQIVIMDDLSCGVVPVDRDIRAYRECLGRAGCTLTRNADEVVRVFCGLPKTLKSKTTKIYLIRHGKTQANLDYCYCGRSDLPLTETGKEELIHKKEKISYPDPEGFKLITSSRIRAKETADIIFPNAKQYTNEAFDEMDFGDFELRKYDKDLQSDPDFVIWTGGNNETNVCPHGESSMMMRRRVSAEFEKLLEAGEDTILVAHGGPIVAIFQKYNPDSGLNYYQISPANGEGYYMEFEGSRLVKYSKLSEQ